MSETGPFTGLIWASETKRIRIWAPFPAGLQNGFRSRFCRSLGAKPRFRPGGAGARPVRGKSRRRLGAGPATVQRRAAGRRVRFRTRLRRKGISGGVVWTDRDPLRQATDPDGPLPGDGRSGAPDASASPVARLGPLSRWVPRRPSVAAPAAPAWRRGREARGGIRAPAAAGGADGACDGAAPARMPRAVAPVGENGVPGPAWRDPAPTASASSVCARDRSGRPSSTVP